MIKNITIFVVSILLFGFTFVDKLPDKLCWSELPMENSKLVFDQCSRSTPKHKRLVVFEDSVYHNAISYLIENKSKISDKLDIEIMKYTCQLVGFLHKRKKFIYINASLLREKGAVTYDWVEHPIIVCDDSSLSWGAVYDIEMNKIIDFQTNGPNAHSIMEL